MLNLALIGAGKFGKHYARLLQDLDGVRLGAVVTRSGTISPEISLPPHLLIASDIHQVLADPQIDGVVIATPSATHATIARAALTSGKHVLVEKPLTLDLSEAEALASLAHTTGRVAMVSFQYLYNDFIHQLRASLEAGDFGQCHTFAVEHENSPVRDDINCFWDVAPHALSIFTFLFHPSQIQHVSGRLRVPRHSQGDMVQVTVHFDRGPVLSLRASWPGERKVRTLTLTSDQLVATLDEPKALEPLTLRRPDGSIQTHAPTSEPLRNELDHFLQCIRVNKPPRTDFSFGSTVTRFLTEISDQLTIDHAA